MKAILADIVNRISDVAASLDALEAGLVHNRQLTSAGIRDRFDTHKQIAESHLLLLRASIDALPD